MGQINDSKSVSDLRRRSVPKFKPFLRSYERVKEKNNYWSCFFVYIVTTPQHFKLSIYYLLFIIL